MSKTIFTQYDPSESWCTEQSDVWLDDVKTFYHRPIRCVIVVHPYFLAQRDTDLLAESGHLSCAAMCIDGSLFSPDLYQDKHATLNRRQKNEISNGEAFVTETNQASWNLLTSTISHGRTIMYMVVPAIEASKMGVGYSFKIFDPGKNGVQLTDNFSMKLKNEFFSWEVQTSFFYTSRSRMAAKRNVSRCVHSKWIRYRM